MKREMKENEMMKLKPIKCSVGLTKLLKQRYSLLTMSCMSKILLGQLNMHICKRFRFPISQSRGLLLTLYILLVILTLCLHPCSAHSWESPGCHRVGHTRQVQIPDCVVFNVTLNACRGYCESFAIPSPSRTVQANIKHLITSRAECCSIRDTHDVKVLVQCVEGLREVVFKSAKSCVCSICRQ